MAELPPDVEEFFEAARRADEPSAVDAERVSRRLAASLGLPAASWAGGAQPADAGSSAASSSTAAAKSASASASVFGSAKLVVVTSAVVIACAAAFYAFDRTHTAPPRATLPAQTQAAQATPPQATPPQAAPQAASAEPNSTPKDPQLRAELALVDLAARALDRGDAASALRKVEEHRRRFGGGFLNEERSALEIMALCLLGRSDEAAALRQSFEQRSPRSPLRAQIAARCAPAAR